MSAAAPPDHEETDVRPIVRRASAGKWTPWVFGIGLAVLALLLFQSLDSRRRAAIAPSTTVPAGGADARIVSPPPLVPPSRFQESYGREGPYEMRQIGDSLDRRLGLQLQPRVVTRAVDLTALRLATEPPISQTGRTVPGTPTLPPPAPPILFERPPTPAMSTPNAGVQADAAVEADRARATRLDLPGFTVPQGTVIAAVLETALDSTKPGFARALVSRDIWSFDGTRVLIPRGSRLFGEYDASLEPGQNRALIRWIRLTRPDGVRMELDSPSADALGRAGVKGKVYTHFLERFGGAILQSALDIGVGLATRPVRDRGVIVALPGSSQVVNPAQQTQVKPTLRVKQGSRVTVFVARDLDFSEVEQ